MFKGRKSTKSQRKVDVNSTKRFVDFLDFNKTNERRLWVRHRRCHTEIPKNSLHIFCFGNQVRIQIFCLKRNSCEFSRKIICTFVSSFTKVFLINFLERNEMNEEAREKFRFVIDRINETILTNNIDVFYEDEDGHLEKVSHEQYMKDYVHFVNGRGEYNGKKLSFSSNILDPIKE